MKRIALALLAAAALLYATAAALEPHHPAWGYAAAFAEAAMVGALADWFAVVALFRHPMGLPIPHTAIIARNKARLGANLADFLCDHFLRTPLLLAKLAQWSVGRRVADWLRTPANAERLAGHAVAAARHALGAFDDARVRDFLGRSAGAALSRIDLGAAAGQLLEALTADGRHQALLDDVLDQLGRLLQGDDVQARITEAIAREIRALRYVALDQVAARAATRKVVAALARTLGETAADARHPLRQRFDQALHDFATRLRDDPALRERAQALRDAWLAQPALAGYLHGLWDELLGWLHADLARPDSAIARRIAALGAGLGQRLADDAAMRGWIDEQLRTAAPRLIDRWREDIRGYVADRVAQWDTDELVDELERHIGRDLQFIRVNSTLVGGLAGLAIHALTQALRG
ncbi:DUF445 domain-containing protein [Xylophilus sp.]|uniref:DUF445 domain-containing protein n=1 Tax=Xylophilus sp. TaxID=2653893 RepID=UPI0013B8B19E|nr:DUF445 domain-containing protein [Xylophilus sp.]KAF1046607.1 MAG: hypothetical protein GAK38_02342 [Xylophilus sp.]